MDIIPSVYIKYVATAIVLKDIEKYVLIDIDMYIDERS